MQREKTRGKEGRDDILFSTPQMQVKIRKAIEDLHYLRTKEYGMKAALQLVGNRYKLNNRQQKAIQGICASEAQLIQRKSSQLSKEELKEQTVYIDAFNVIIILESYYSDGYVFRGMDGCYRDLASVHGTYKKIQYTEEILLEIGMYLKTQGIQKAIWVFDQPVSNSGKMKKLLEDIARDNGFIWEIVLEFNPDKFLVAKEGICISADAWILDRAKRWFNLAHVIISKKEKNTVLHFNTI